ncbi:hypothetical protein QYE76_037967 [Lolium multiflorum]|uniref:Uncharacterized protein n=1 Tax=Lolium multiflorum TaxID=4521 RepID=A0AAD8WQT4_LOLMU|nr:hypothetical protein QYE76_037967 [Lolium multiflorum]
MLVLLHRFVLRTVPLPPTPTSHVVTPLAPAVLEAAVDVDPAPLVVALRSSKDSSAKGIVGAYGAAPVATTAARDAAFLAVFIEGKLVGGLDRLMAKHIAGELVPVLKQAGALWL